MDINTILIAVAIFVGSMAIVFVGKRLGFKGKALSAIQAVKFIVDDVIKAAEQHKKNDGWTNEQAKDFAVERIYDHLIDLELDAYISIGTVDTIIEGAVGAYNLVRGFFSKPKAVEELPVFVDEEPETV